MIPHRLDPPNVVAAADLIGRLNGAYPEAASAPLDMLVQTAVKAGYTGCLSGLRCRLAWAMADAASEYSAAQRRPMLFAILAEENAWHGGHRPARQPVVTAFLQSASAAREGCQGGR